MRADGNGDPDFATYLQEIRRHPLLDREEEHELARVIQSDSWDAWMARDRMIRANLRLVVSEAKRYRNRGLPLSDLVEEGNVGLVHAVAKFDPDMQTRFSTYATWWIRQAIRRSIQSKSKMVRIPAYMAEELQRWRRHARIHEQEHGCRPSDDEMLDAMQPTRSRRRLLLRLFHSVGPSGDTVSLDTLFESVDALVDTRAGRPDLVDFGSMDRQRVLDLLEDLPEREATILRMRFGLGEHDSACTLRQTAKVLGLSRERVRQLEHEAVAMLRKALGVSTADVPTNGRAARRTRP